MAESIASLRRVSMTGSITWNSKKQGVDQAEEDATITMPEMAQLLGTTRSSVYTILDNPKYSHFFEFIVIAEKKRITKESFQKFLEGQDRYKLDPSNDYEKLAQEQNIALANFRRKKLSQTGIRGSNENIKVSYGCVLSYSG